MSNRVHRSYRIDRRQQLTFEALCHGMGLTPSKVLVQLINQHVAAVSSADKTLGCIAYVLAGRRLRRPDSDMMQVSDYDDDAMDDYTCCVIHPPTKDTE